MTYKQLKILIIIIPTFTIGLWEFVRHTYLLPVVSMRVGSMLSPLIVFAVSMTLLRKLFATMEGVQEQLNRERAAKAVLLEREHLARELHDGAAQSLFLLAVQADRLGSGLGTEEREECVRSVRKTAHQANAYVRQAISSLSIPPVEDPLPWTNSIQSMVREYESETGMKVHLDWRLPDQRLSSKEKVELFASLREALLNVRKHARAARVWLEGRERETGWICSVIDDGQGFSEADLQGKDRFGLAILRERAAEMRWTFSIRREQERTRVEIEKRGGAE